MYCRSCGRQVDKGLKFCNGCGAKLGRTDENDAEGTPGKMLDNILTTLFLTVFFGMGILVGLVAVLLGNGVSTEMVAIVTITYIAAILGIAVILGRQVPKLIDAKLKMRSEADHEPSPAQLRPLTTAQLEEYREPAGSVTEHTTRTLEEAPIRRS